LRRVDIAGAFRSREWISIVAAKVSEELVAMVDRITRIWERVAEGVMVRRRRVS
jgi:hypothetical protein